VTSKADIYYESLKALDLVNQDSPEWEILANRMDTLYYWMTPADLEEFKALIQKEKEGAMST